MAYFLSLLGESAMGYKDGDKDQVKYYPININITDKKCIVLGGGKVAERKVESLLKCGGAVTVISPDLSPQLKTLLVQGKIRHIPRGYRAGDMEGVFLVFGATDDPRVNEEVGREGQEKGALVNIVDTPERCSFIVPSVVEREDLVITISTNGKSPALARRIREELEASYGEEYMIFLSIMGSIREKALKTNKDSDSNRQLFYKLIDSDMLRLVREGKREKVNDILKETLGNDYALEDLGVTF